MKKYVSIRFYEELNDFLGPRQHKKEFNAVLQDAISIKDVIGSLGVPSTEVDLILVNGHSVPFSYTVQSGDRISVYPVFETFDISKITGLRPKPLRNPKFILDADLGELAEIMRTFGFDAVYRSDYKKHDIVDLSLTENRTILTRNKELLLSKEVARCYLVKQTNPARQINEIINHFDLKLSLQ